MIVDSSTRQKPTEVAVFGGGCFWCTEAVYSSLLGVLSVKSGYCGGSVSHPSYEDVCTGRTGHIEVVRIVFDPSKPDGTPRKKLECSRILELGWEQGRGLIKGLKETYKWYLEHAA